MDFKGISHIIRIVSAIALLLFQILAATPALAAEPLRLSVSMSPLSLPIFVAQEQGYFAAEGLTLNVKEVLGGHRAMQQVQDGSADLGTCSEAVIMFRSFETKDFLILATFVTSDDDVKLITTSGTGITTPEQLKGKRIGTVIGAASDYYLHTLLVLNGIDPKLVHVTHLQPEDMAEALANAQVDAIAIWEPNAFQVLKSVPGATLLTKSGFYIETFNLVARSELKGVRDDDLLKLLRALERAERFIQNEPAKALAILRTRLQTN